MSEGVEWSLHACHLLAEVPPDACLSSLQLAAFFDLAAAYFSKHLQALTRAGITNSSTGPQGGYRLARSAASISFLEVVEAIDGPAPAFRCGEIRQRGPAALPARMYRNPCAIAATMAGAEAAWRHELANVTIADLVASFGPKAPAAKARTQDWLAEATGPRPAARNSTSLST